MLLLSLQSVLDFSKEEESDSLTLVRLLEQSIGRDSNINSSAISGDIITELIALLVEHLNENKESLANYSKNFLVESEIMSLMHKFLEERQHKLRAEANQNDIPFTAFYVQKSPRSPAPHGSVGSS